MSYFPVDNKAYQKIIPSWNKISEIQPDDERPIVAMWDENMDNLRVFQIWLTTC